MLLGVYVREKSAIRRLSVTFFIFLFFYRRFYNNAPGDSLLQLYLSLVRPHLDYASAIWSLHLMKDKDALENVQKLACRMATRIWDSSYQDLLELVNLPTLEHRRLG